MSYSKDVEGPVVVHTAGVRFRPEMLWRRFFQELRASRYVIWEMLKRDVTSQYRRSVAGLFLSLLPGLAITGWAVLFRNSKLIHVSDVNIPYPFYVLFGMMVWTAFLESVEAPITGTVSEQGLISKSNVSSMAVAAAKLGQVLFNFFIKTLLVATAAIWYRVPLTPAILLVPFGVLLVVALGSSIGLILAPINLLYPDVARIVPVITTFWFFVTPVIFTSPDEGSVSIIMNKLNPVTPLLAAIRDMAFRGAPSMPRELVFTSLLTVVFLAAAITFHRIAMPIVIDRASS